MIFASHPFGQIGGERHFLVGWMGSRSCQFGMGCRAKDSTCGAFHPDQIPCLKGLSCPARGSSCSFLHLDALSEGEQGASFIWMWEADGKQMLAYPDDLNGLLERFYDLFLEKGTYRFLTPPILRHLDKETQQYIIDFHHWTQTNIKTMYKRRIVRGTANKGIRNPLEDSFSWMWQLDSRKMEPYLDHLNILLESFYSQFLEEGIAEFRTPPTVRYNDQVSLEYAINFNRWEQCNVQTGYTRSIVRGKSSQPTITFLKACGARPETLSRLSLLSSSSAYQFDTKDQMLASVARFFLRECRMAIHGGFVRDWLLDYSEPSDIDVNLSPQKSMDDAEKDIKRLVDTNGLSLTLVSNGTVKAGHLVKYKIQNGTTTVDVDFLKPNLPLSTLCDADVNNLLLSWEGQRIQLEQKVALTSYTLNQTVANIALHQFHLHEPFSRPKYAADRAKKLLHKGYRCLSGIPLSQKGQFTSQEQQKIQFS